MTTELANFTFGNGLNSTAASKKAYGAKTQSGVHAGELGERPSIGQPKYVAGAAVGARRDAIEGENVGLCAGPASFCGGK